MPGFLTGNGLFMPHGHCYLWTPSLLWLMVLSDLLIAVSYFAIPIMLARFVRRRPDLPFRGILLLFTAFIVLCGLTHAWDVVTTWVPSYWVEGVLKAATGVVSFMTAVVLWPTIPKALQLRSPAELEAANEKLEASNRQLASTVAELEAANARLQEAEQLKTRLLENLSHELRTPLTLVQAPVQALLAGDLGEAPKEWLPMLRSIATHSERLEELIQNALELARLDAGELEVVAQPVDAASLLDELVGDLARLATRKGVALTLDTGDVPRAVLLDRYLFERVVFNLVSNAIKFTPSGGAVACRLDWSDDRATLAVEDTGPGLTDDEQRVVFERFRQGDDARTRRHGGAGLGLALVAEVCKALGGEVRVESTPGQGATFIATLAAPETDAPAPARAAASASRYAAPDPDSSGVFANLLPRDEEAPRIVLAEDNDDMAHLVGTLLAPLAQIDRVRDGEAALQTIRQQHPALVLTDVMMPGLDGLSLCRILKADPETRDIPVVILSARGGREALIEGWLAGADEYLFKPFHPRELTTRVRTLLHGAQARVRATTMRARAEQMRAHNEELTALATALSHDVAAPLRIIGQSLRLVRPEADPTANEEILEAIRQRVDALQALTTGLLSWLRAGAQPPPSVPARLDELLGESLALVEIPAGFELDLDAGSATLLVPRTEAVQVFSNLLRNAIVHHDRDHGRVMVRANAIGEAVEVIVMDDGPGIPESLVERATELFVHGPGGGTGVGLALVHRILTSLGGRLEIRRRDPRGTAIHTWWPRATTP